ncbi:helix-turn-helix domain-containing protein [Bacteroides thetaiotaomicron]|uniref:helix-turn-helix domain-containing protein n=1 Tax=Bacteroides thetaiotaomicron TaxID=818 RepID=UPI0028F3E3F7|nr:helix-turn-helix domain-containing protein [Bacteroides thetaiotaomicron]WOG21075.1 helix-turn-helix domain-containing protein [Bacteroides thetaiotaomicron]
MGTGKQLDQAQQAVISLFSPFIDEIVNRVSEKVLAATTKKEPKFYTRKETAKILHVTLPTLARLTKDGLLVSKHVGNRILYEAEAIDEAVKQQVIFKYRRA